MIGKGVRKNLRQAAEWYRKAAEQGHIDAYTNLGLMYANGLGVRLDFEMAAKWYRAAADLRRAHGAGQSRRALRCWFRCAKGLRTGIHVA